MNNKLTIIRGVPGSGKTTYAKSHYNCIILENDMFHMHNGVYEYSSENQRDAVVWCRGMARTALECGMDVVVSNTFTQRRYIDDFRTMAKQCHADFEVIRMTGNHDNVHNVPQNVLESMRNHFEDYPGERFV